MRYAEYEPGSTTTTARRPQRRTVDLIREANRTDQYWVLHPEPDGRWTLRHLDGASGLLGDAEHESPKFGPDSSAAFAWAVDLVDVTGWRSMSRPYPGAFVDEVFDLIREITRTARPDRQVMVRIEPGPDALTLLTVRERWTRTGMETDPLYTCESTGFEDEADMLRQVADWFGLANAWVTAKEGIEYWHANGTAAAAKIQEDEPNRL